MDPVLLFFAGLTAFILFRLMSVMGTRSGHEQRHDLDGMQSKAAASQRQTDDVDEDQQGDEAAPTPVSTNARVLREADPAFNESEYLAGARAAYEMIVEAFASGDLRSIRAYLSDSVYDAFKGAVVAREEAGHSTDLKFIGVDHAAIVDSQVDRDQMRAVTEFTSNQVRVTRDKDGNVVDGDPNRIELVKDRWTFSKKRSSRDPNWILVATGGAA
ncbi:Transporter [hydrothermal vent metagenome]|uniref:Transporter n=1 Tax=hydrothermal vent metagenome TaxID=652676 RepID=A0A3B0S052_9ZZZZ